MKVFDKQKNEAPKSEREEESVHEVEEHVWEEDSERAWEERKRAWEEESEKDMYKLEQEEPEGRLVDCIVVLMVGFQWREQVKKDWANAKRELREMKRIMESYRRALDRSR